MKALVHKPIVDSSGTAESYVEPRPNDPVVGKWYWLEVESDEYDEEGNSRLKRGARRLACVTHIGSNFVALEAPSTSKYENVGNPSWRIHINDFDKVCQYEPDHKAVIQNKVAGHQRAVTLLMGEVQELTERLALNMGRNALNPGQETAALAIAGDTTGKLDEYKKALVKAKEKELPELFEQIKIQNMQLARWMQADLIPLEAAAEQLKPTIEAVKGRIFNVELYSGLIELATEIKEGEPAPTPTPVHLFQRMHYMDEECLVNYKAGGMKFADIHAFDKWISIKANYERILPMPRSIVAFRVRHEEREWNGVGRYIDFWHEAQQDKYTYLIIRNGTKLSRLTINSTSFEFDEKLFPDLDAQKLTSEPLMARFWGNKEEPEEIVTLGEYEARKADYETKKAAAEAKGEHYWSGTFERGDWHPFNKTSVYFDEMTKHVQDQITKHNRIVLVLQGLLDRSLVLHPHPTWQLWTPQGFSAALRLVYDDSRTLVPGPKPDFDAYRKRLNATIGVNSITVGQHAYWYAREVERFKKDNRRSHYTRDGRERTPDLYGNPGPKDLARVEEIKVKRNGQRLFKFSWEREKHWQTIRRERQWGSNVSETYTCSIWVPEDKLFNVTAYTPGDFHQFFDDPRTRAEYLKWAPYLLTSEDWHSGKMKLESLGVELDAIEEDDEVNEDEGEDSDNE